MNLRFRHRNVENTADLDEHVHQRNDCSHSLAQSNVFGLGRIEGNLGLKLGHPNDRASSIHNDDEASTRHYVLGTIGVGLTPSSGKIGVDKAFDTTGGIWLVNDASLGISK